MGVEIFFEDTTLFSVNSCRFIRRTLACRQSQRFAYWHISTLKPHSSRRHVFMTIIVRPAAWHKRQCLHEQLPPKLCKADTQKPVALHNARSMAEMADDDGVTSPVLPIKDCQIQSTGWYRVINCGQRDFLRWVEDNHQASFRVISGSDSSSAAVVLSVTPLAPSAAARSSSQRHHTAYRAK